MKTIGAFVAAVMIIVFATADLGAAAEFYVVKSRSGILMVVDHRPKGNATVVKGPFKTRDEARKALKELDTPRK
jgi:hypothetical protein